MAVVGTITGQFDTPTRHWRVTVTGVTNGNTSPAFLGKGYQIGQYVLSGTLGTTPSFQWQGSNDGVTFVSIGSAVTTLPAGGTLSSPDSPGAYAFYQLANNAASGSSINAVVDFVSQNAS